ncbi:MAG: hypothetical protein IPF99_30310 [Deltaproteobacteria bacterium]|nr:hypothetical protein [Deltaproteobacteria bacterium]
MGGRAARGVPGRRARHGGFLDSTRLAGGTDPGGECEGHIPNRPVDVEALAGQRG